jgi:hypothetical protein
MIDNLKKRGDHFGAHEIKCNAPEKRKKEKENFNVYKTTSKARTFTHLNELSDIKRTPSIFAAKWVTEPSPPNFNKRRSRGTCNLEQLC